MTYWVYNIDINAYFALKQYIEFISYFSLVHYSSEPLEEFIFHEFNTKLMHVGHAFIDREFEKWDILCRINQ